MTLAGMTVARSSLRAPTTPSRRGRSKTSSYRRVTQNAGQYSLGYSIDQHPANTMVTGHFTTVTTVIATAMAERIIG